MTAETSASTPFQEPRRVRFGIKAELLLAFAAMTAMTVVASVVAWYAFAEIDRARLDGDPRGFLKLITRDGDRILGAHIIGPRAGELIHEYALALQAGLPASSIADTVHAYPTLSEINRFAALQSQDAWLTGYRVRGARHLKRFSDWFQALTT